MKTGIVICAWNCAAEVEIAARSAYETCSGEGLPFEILIHDDHSEIEPLALPFKKWDLPHTYYLCQSVRKGLTHAWNRGIEWARERGCRAVALCNQDIEFSPGWLPRFVNNIQQAPAISPLSNAPGVHSDKRTLQGQDVRKFLPEWRGKVVEPTRENFLSIMEKIKDNPLVEADGIKGFFLGFDVEWLVKHRIGEGEYYSTAHATANGGVGGSENEIFQRLGVRPHIAADIYIHHFREYGNGKVGKARKLFRRAARV